MHVDEIFGMRKGAEFILGQPTVVVNVRIAKLGLVLCRAELWDLGQEYKSKRNFRDSSK